ncbi:MAG: hypothetical protein ACLFRG_13940 [Desulfococcaceae bacterium]
MKKTGQQETQQQPDQSRAFPEGARKPAGQGAIRKGKDEKQIQGIHRGRRTKFLLTFFQRMPTRKPAKGDHYQSGLTPSNPFSFWKNAGHLPFAKPPPPVIGEPNAAATPRRPGPIALGWSDFFNGFGRRAGRGAVPRDPALLKRRETGGGNLAGFRPASGRTPIGSLYG